MNDESFALARRLLDGIPGVVIDRDEVEVAIMRGFEHGRRLGLTTATATRHCRVCGCTSLATCRGEDPCHWVAVDLCSACEPFLEEPS